MARTDAKSLWQGDGSIANKLVELYGSMLSVATDALVSGRIKNRTYSPEQAQFGSVEAYRMQASVVQDEGTARTAGAGNKVIYDPVTVNLDTNREIVEEFKKAEIQRSPVTNLIELKRAGHAESISNELDTAFFAEAVSAGNAVDVSAVTDIQDKVATVIRALGAVRNDWIKNPVARSAMRICITSEYFDALEDYINTLPNPSNGGVGSDVFKSVPVLVNDNQTKDLIIYG